MRQNLIHEDDYKTIVSSVSLSSYICQYLYLIHNPLYHTIKDIEAQK